jgi:hypothetical protein
VRALSRDIAHDDFDGVDEIQHTARYDPIIDDIHRYRLRIVHVKYLFKVIIRPSRPAQCPRRRWVGSWFAGKPRSGRLRLSCRVYEGLMSPARDLLNLYCQYLQMRVQHRLLHREVMGVLGRRRLRN